MHNLEMVGIGYVGGVLTVMLSSLFAVKHFMKNPAFIAKMFMKYARRGT